MEQGTFLTKLTQLGKKILPAGSHLWLYGSRARGDARPDSDWDLLVLLDKDKKSLDDFDKYAYPFIEYGLDRNTAVSAFIYTYSDWNNHPYSLFHYNVEADKVVLL